MSSEEKIKELKMVECYHKDNFGYTSELVTLEFPSMQEIFDKINEIIRHINNDEKTYYEDVEKTYFASKEIEQLYMGSDGIGRRAKTLYIFFHE